MILIKGITGLAFQQACHFGECQGAPELLVFLLKGTRAFYGSGSSTRASVEIIRKTEI